MIGSALLAFALRFAVILGVLGGAVCAVFCARPFVIAYAIGFAVSVVNLYALKRIARSFETSSAKRAAVLLALKFVGLIGVIAGALYFFKSDVMGLLAGFSVSVCAILIASLWPQKTEGEHHG